MNKCKGCEWYNKPYWSIINPCENCPREGTNVEIITRWVDPTIEEKDKEIEKLQKDLRDACEVIEQLKKDKRKVAKYIKEHENDLYDTYDGLPFGSIKGVKQILKLVTEVNDSNK